MDSQIRIRAGESSDCKHLRHLIQELANFEEMPDGPKLTEETLVKDGFNKDIKKRYYQSFIAEYNNAVVGYAMFFKLFHSATGIHIHLEDIYVVSDHRKKGIGGLLFETVVKECIKLNYKLMDFVVLDWNPAQDFYKAKKAIDYTNKEGWKYFRILKKDFPTDYALITPELKIRDSNRHDWEHIKTLCNMAKCNYSKDGNYSLDDNTLEENYNVIYGYYVAELNNEIIGYALHCYGYSTWNGIALYLQEIVVSPKFEAETIIRDLIFKVLKKAQIENCCWLDFWTENSKLGNYFIKFRGANITENEKWHLYRLYIDKK